MNNLEAARVFANLSNEYPGSGVAQSAGIALYCKENGVQPNDFTALLYDDGLLRQLCEAAQAHHKRALQQNLASKAPPVVSGQMLTALLGEEINFARGLMHLSSEELQKIIDNNPSNFEDQAPYLEATLVRSFRFE